MSWQPPSEPPPAHPFPPLASSSSSSAPPPPRRQRAAASRSSSSQTLYFGSGAPVSSGVYSRRAPPRKGRSAFFDSPPASTPPPSPSTPLVLLTDGTCITCDIVLRYPRSSGSFSCSICGTVNDLTLEKRRQLNVREEFQPVESTPVSEAQFLALLARFERRATETDEELALRLHALEVSGTAEDAAEEEDDPEDVLVAYLVSAFNNLPSIEASFRPSSPFPVEQGGIASPSPSPSRSTDGLPKQEILSKVYDLVKRKPAAMEVLRAQIEAVLRRPGPTVLESDGGWLITLFESPVFSSDFTPDPTQRRWLLAHFIGLLSNLPNSLHHRLVTCLSHPSYPRRFLLEKTELVCSFLSWRIGEAASSIGGGMSPEEGGAPVDYRTDWRVKAGARVASLLFNASLATPSSHRLPLPTFYVTLIDSLGSSALLDDFTQWEDGSAFERGQLSLCQYPFLLSLGVKMGLLGWDGERQMMARAHEAYRSNFALNQLESPLLVLKIRREHVVSDSLRQISLNRVNLKKQLRIQFEDEEGVDAGGLRKEWFLLLCRQLFDPQYGMFLLDPDSQLCFFNPASLETDDFWLVGVVLGLALYNMSTLDVPLPLATYKKLRSEPVTLSDLSQFSPALARGLQYLLDWNAEEHDGASVEATFCRSFVGGYEAWGETVEEELCEGGRERAVTEENRAEYVRLLVDFHLTRSVASQFDAFAEGFNEVVGGNALALLRAEELELVVRGSPEPLEIDQLRAMMVYEGFLGEEDPTVELFWLVFRSFSPLEQRRLLAFVTASDRLPATGTSSLQLKLQCLGPDCDRLPTSHTCFNTLALYRYGTREKMERMLRRAMEESEGFGLR
ncbi:hypothetical protein JCM8547_000803 [Rhodosporidiobolus lusitaniae]